MVLERCVVLDISGRGGVSFYCTIKSLTAVTTAHFAYLRQKIQCTISGITQSRLSYRTRTLCLQWS